MARLKIVYTISGEEPELETIIKSLQTGELSIENVYDEDSDSVDYEIVDAA